ncbi:TRAP transporter small permease [candidate division WOR-3 bacterium]|nr:TRAP transporter small permease [candidate division WOR-3 bacterium]
MSLKKIFKTLSDWRNKILGYFVVFLVGIMVVTVLWQVFTRLVLRFPAVWTEESSTYMLMWCGVVGAAYAYGQKAHIGMEYFAHKLDTNHRRMLEVVIAFLVGFFAFRVMLIGGINFVRNAFVNHQTSPTMGIPTGYLYLCLPISAIFIITYSIEFVFKDISFLMRKEER